jgi:hypothetical protein
MGAPEITIEVEPKAGIWRTDGVPMTCREAVSGGGSMVIEAAGGKGGN